MPSFLPSSLPSLPSFFLRELESRALRNSAFSWNPEPKGQGLWSREHLPVAPALVDLVNRPAENKLYSGREQGKERQRLSKWAQAEFAKCPCRCEGRSPFISFLWGNFSSSEFGMTLTSKVISNTHRNEQQQPKARPGVMNQLYVPAEVTGTPQHSSALSLREFNLTARESNTHAKRASENKVKLHRLTLRRKYLRQSQRNRIETHRFYLPDNGA